MSRNCMKSCRKILMLSFFAAACYNMRDIFLVLLYTYGTVDGSEFLHQLRHIKLFKSWDIFPYQLRSNLPPTGFFHVDVYVPITVPDLSPRNSCQACECMVQEVKLGTEFVAEKKYRSLTFIGFVSVWYCLFSPTWCIEVGVYRPGLILLKCSSLLICCCLKGFETMGFILDSFITVW